METTRNRLQPHVDKFFKDLSIYLDTRLLFFGSVQRPDYIEGSSDIDVDVFTDNEKSVMSKMQAYLHISKRDFKSVVWRLLNGSVVYGYKTMYKAPDGSFSAEFSIYNERFKDGILAEHLYKMSLPWYVTIALIILKVLYYTLGIIPKDNYNWTKRKVLTWGIGLPDSEFVVLDGT